MLYLSRMVKKIPVQIDRPPIIESILELRFSSPSGELLVGQLYGVLSEKYPSSEKLAPADIPLQIRESEPNFRYAPHYSLTKEGFNVGIGPHVVSLACKITEERPYPGWRLYKKELESLVEDINPVLTKAINSFERIGLRYINLLKEESLWEVSDLKLTGPWNLNDARSHDLYLGFKIDNDELTSNLRVAANAHVNFGGERSSGLVVDVDTFQESEIAYEDILPKAELAHQHSKEIFFNLLKEEYVSKRNPRY